jgi:hypothetical protein
MTPWEQLRQRARNGRGPEPGATVPSHVATTAIESSKAVPRRIPPGVTRSTGEAMDLLEERRAELIARGREEAVLLAREHGFVHSRMVRERLEELGLLTDPDLKDYWLGPLFNNPRFEKLSKTPDHTYGSPVRNIHERAVHRWRARSDEELAVLLAARAAAKKAAKRARG